MKRMMSMSNNNPNLDRARQLLSPELMAEVNKEPFTVRGWKILERWAANSPAKLKSLAGQGTIVFVNRLLEQQTLEANAIESADRSAGLAEMEILQMQEIRTEL